MIHVVTHENRKLYEDAIAEMHRLRRVHFVEERGWSAMTVRGGGEYDAYDDEAATYLLAIEEDGSITASMRMRPAQSGSILADLFPHLIGEEEPNIGHPRIWEISRYFASGRGRGRGGAKRRAEIRLASLEVALRHKVKRLVGMIDIEVLPAMLDGSGWRVRPLGLPAAYDEGVAQAIVIEVSQAALVEMQESQGLASPVTLNLDASRHPRLPPQEVETLLGLEQVSQTRRRTVLALVRRLAELEAAGASEEELETLVSRVAEAFEADRRGS